MSDTVSSSSTCLVSTVTTFVLQANVVVKEWNDNIFHSVIIF